MLVFLDGRQFAFNFGNGAAGKLARLLEFALALGIGKLRAQVFELTLQPLGIRSAPSSVRCCPSSVRRICLNRSSRMTTFSNRMHRPPQEDRCIQAVTLTARKPFTKLLSAEVWGATISCMRR
ncbi:hypothetical protein DEM27_18995 [Metarhizobium album]|jgi:hypothetical protein|uniref:Uncharacterized protein n=1 Tax=Metarhizobium album TaxID=2182425 RepID=A0A2U2DMR6_9HYPH|nr:hypothetical protein DEM27_18995 [Rhizobium album]